MKLFSMAIFALVAFQQIIADLDGDWDLFKTQFGKVYASHKDEALRKEIYAAAVREIEKHNKEYINGIASFEMGINEFDDLTDAEYADKFKPCVLNDEFGRAAFAQNFTQRNLPDYVNWVEHGYNNPVLSQGSCGSCYAFAGVAALEGQYFIKHRQLIQLSHQELVDCGKQYGNAGCSGGFQRNIYKYILSHELGYASSNPYLGHEDVCRRGEPRMSISTFYEIPTGDEEALKQAVATIGPIPIDMDASLRSFHRYKKGIYYDANCRTNWLSHAITVVGYGSENGQDYWLVRNSWGKRWGEGGHIKIARNKNNHCGVATRAVYPVVN